MIIIFILIFIIFYFILFNFKKVKKIHKIQSINKREDNTVIVLKLSDFNLKSLTLVEEFFKKQKTSIKDIQFFSSSE